MLRITIAVTLAILLILAEGAPTAAHSSGHQYKHQPKEIPHTLNSDITGTLLSFYPPEREPDSYRISWTFGKRWRSIYKPNTTKAGNMIVPGNVDTFSKGVRLPDGVTPPQGRTYRIRVRAIYKGERNGPWNCRVWFPKSNEYAAHFC